MHLADYITRQALARIEASAGAAARVAVERALRAAYQQGRHDEAHYRNRGQGRLFDEASSTRSAL